MGRAYRQTRLKTGRGVCTLVFFMLVAIGSVYCGVSMLGYTALQVVPYALCALAGTVMVLNISEWLCKHDCRLRPFLMFVGDHTLEVLTWHFLTFKIVSLLIILIHQLPIGQLACFPTIRGYGIYYWPLYSLAGIGLPALAVYLRKECFTDGKAK